MGCAERRAGQELEAYEDVEERGDVERLRGEVARYGGLTLTLALTLALTLTLTLTLILTLTLTLTLTCAAR